MTIFAPLFIYLLHCVSANSLVKEVSYPSYGLNMLCDITTQATL